MEDRSGFLAGLIVGAMIGLGLGIMLAPRPGQETRDQLKEKAQEGKMASKMFSLERRCCDDGCMATVAGTHFNETEIHEQTAALDALGDEIRLKMIRLLAQHDALCVCELEQVFEVEQPTISHHLKVLREAGLVDVQRRGTWAYYSLRKDVLKRLTQGLLEVL